MADPQAKTANDEPRRLIPALAPLYDSVSPYAYPLVRFTTGAILIPHGWGKIIGGGVGGTAESMAGLGLEPALLLAWYIGLLELVGGTLLAVGFLTRLWAIQIVGFMAVAAFYVHWSMGYFWTGAGYEVPLFWGLMALAILLRGGGPLSVDRALGREL